MKTMRTLADVGPALYGTLSNSRQQLHKGGKGLQRAKQLFKELGNPQESYKSIHIAGTSGKGSTSYYISHLLKAHGFKVGTHVSPHIYDLRERFMIDLELPSEAQVINCANEVIEAASQYDIHARPTYFDVTVGMAFSLFADNQVDYAVVETGMGGLYDSTNTINRQDKFSVITRLGLDHTEILGSTIAEIAAQKAGILNDNGQGVALKPSDASAQTVLKNTARQKKHDLTITDVSRLASNVRTTEKGIVFDYHSPVLRIDSIALNSLAQYQIENAALALCALEALSKRDSFTLDPDRIRQAFSEATIPARMELREVSGRRIVVDGAHNPQKIQTLIQSLRSYTQEPPVWLFAAKRTKDIKDSLNEIAHFCDSIAFTEFFRGHPTQYLGTMSMSAQNLKQTWQQGKRPLVLGEFSNPAAALKAVIKQTDPDKLIVVSGSMYMIGELYISLQQNGH